MRIGIDCRLWNESGVGRYVRNLVWELGKLDTKNTYALFFREKEFLSVDVPSSNFTKVLADVRWHTLSEQFHFRSILEKELLDIVHFPYFSVPILYNRPFVVTIHDLILHHFPTGQASTLPLPLYGLKLLSYKFVISQAAKKASSIIAVSNATKREIIDHLGIESEKIIVTYEGVDGKINSKLKTQNSKLQLKNQKYFLYVGNAYPHKNLDRLIQAFGILLKEHDDILLVLVGKEDYFYKRLKEKVKSDGLLEKINFYGYETDEELSLLYKNSMALVIPSLMEGFGLSALEAMASGCLVLASDIAVHREIIAKVAIFFNPTDAYDILEKMKNVLDGKDSSLYSELKKKGKQQAKQFTWKEMAARTLTVYESCSTPCSK